MSWTPPMTWVNGLLVAASTLNQQIRDNLRYLKGQLGAIHLENAIDLQEIAQPSSPATGRVRIWNTNDPFRQMLYARFSDGTQRRMTHYAAIASRSTSFAHPGNNTWQIVPMPTLVHSSHPSLTLHNGAGLVAPETGVYIIAGSLAADGTSAASVYGGICIDNTNNVIAESGFGGTSAWFSANLSIITTLNANQTVYLTMFSSTATNTDFPVNLSMVSI